MLPFDRFGRAAQEEARLLRFPTIHGDQIVFTHAGDLYTVASTGGLARKLTSHEGFEMFPRLSPDGKWLAFTGQYDGNTEVYVMPAEGGVPKRLTYTATLGRDDIGDRMGPNNLVIGWKHDSKTILFRSRMHSFNDFIGSLYTVRIEGGLPQELPLPRGGFGSYSPDDSKLVYNRVFREFRTWKRYRGGMADDIWIHDFHTKKSGAHRSDPAGDIIPDVGRRPHLFPLRPRRAINDSIFTYDTKTKDVKQLTRFTDFDCKFPCLGDKAIVFENGGWIYKFELATEKTAKVPVRIVDDFAAAGRARCDVRKSIGGFGVSPDGKRASSRPAATSSPCPPTGADAQPDATPAVHDRDPEWSPDGKSIAFISDATGEDEIHLSPRTAAKSPNR